MPHHIVTSTSQVTGAGVLLEMVSYRVSLSLRLAKDTKSKPLPYGGFWNSVGVQFTQSGPI